MQQLREITGRRYLYNVRRYFNIILQRLPLHVNSFFKKVLTFLTVAVII